MGFFSDMTEKVAKMALGEQGKPPEEWVSYADERNWGYMHSEAATVVLTVLGMANKDSLLHLSSQTRDQQLQQEQIRDGVFGADVEVMPEGDVYPFTVGNAGVGGTTNMRRVFYGLTDRGWPFSAGTASWKKDDPHSDATREFRSRVACLAVPGLNMDPVSFTHETSASNAWGGVFGNDVDTEYHQFNTLWDVKGRNRDQILTLLTPSMQQKLVEFAPRRLNVGFHGARIYIASPHREVLTGFVDGGLRVGVGTSSSSTDDFLPPAEVDQWILQLEQLTETIPLLLRDREAVQPAQPAPSVSRPQRPRMKPHPQN